MVYTAIIREIERLSVEERLRLLEALTRSLRDSLSPDHKQAKEFSANCMRGLLKPEGPIPPDEELKEDYLSYLDQKYS